MPTDPVHPFPFPPGLNPPVSGFSGNDTAGTPGVLGQAITDPGVVGSSVSSDGVQGATETSSQAGVVGRNGNKAIGFLAGSDLIFHQHAGVYGQSDQQGVFGNGTSDSATGVFGNSTGGGFGVRGESVEGVAIQGQSFGKAQGLAGRFIGNVHVQGNPGTSSGDLRVEGTSSFGGAVTMDGNHICKGNITAFDVNLSGADCAEDFDVAAKQGTVDPGTVMIIDGAGALRPCEDAYDRKVTGVISGAGNYKPGIVLDKHPSATYRLPLALVGKVYCKVDAAFGSIEVGDLLTTSATHGHAMKANDPARAFGAVIGKALKPLVTGRGLIPILVALQ